MLWEKGIWQPAIVGVETKGKLWRRCRVPNKMDSDLQGRYDRISYVEQTNKRRDELNVRLHRQLLLTYIYGFNITKHNIYCVLAAKSWIKTIAHRDTHTQAHSKQ